MQFIDEAKIYIKAGNGGNGSISFRREKFIEHGGPDGGNGGNGGSIVVQSNSQLSTLLHFKYKRHFIAKNGEQGKGSNCTGKSKSPLVIKVPVGTQILSEDKKIIIYDLEKENDKFEILKGGKGGLGNNYFKSSINQSPRKKTKGMIGQEMNIVLRLKLLSDVGLVGLPNVGKSTILASITAASPKIANYPFTTLKPVLGMVYRDDQEFVVADIPGLIRGASKGKGIGDRFLKHIERCKVLVHVLDATSNNIREDYAIIRNELDLYSPLFKEKKELICFNKIDLISEKLLKEKLKNFNKIYNNDIYRLSGSSKVGLSNLLNKLLTLVISTNNSKKYVYL